MFPLVAAGVGVYVEISSGAHWSRCLTSGALLGGIAWVLSRARE